MRPGKAELQFKEKKTSLQHLQKMELIPVQRVLLCWLGSQQDLEDDT